MHLNHDFISLLHDFGDKDDYLLMKTILGLEYYISRLIYYINVLTHEHTYART